MNQEIAIVRDLCVQEYNKHITERVSALSLMTELCVSMYRVRRYWFWQKWFRRNQYEYDLEQLRSSIKNASQHVEHILTDKQEIDKVVKALEIAELFYQKEIRN